MPQLSTVVLTDREATPVNHTFLPRDIVNGIATVREGNGVAIGESRMTISKRRTATRSKGKLVLSVPVVQTETINGISRPTVVRYALVSMETSFDLTSSKQERANIIGMLMSGLDPSKTLVNDTFVEDQNVY